MKTWKFVLWVCVVGFCICARSLADGPQTGSVLYEGDTFLARLTGEPINRGFLIVDGRYVNRPYRVMREDGVIKINGYVLPLDLIANDQYFDRRHPVDSADGLDRMPYVDFDAPPWLRSTEGSIEYRFFQYDLLIVQGDSFTSVPAASLREFVDILESDLSADEKVQVATGISYPPIYSAVLRQLMETYVPGEGLKKDVDALEAYVQAMRVEAAHRRAEAARDPLWLQFLPMLALVAAVASILVVIRLGMTTVRAKGAARQWRHLDDSGQRGQHVQKMIALLVLLNVLDLVFTLSANTTGQFYEANPITRPLMDTPALLSGFKVVMVSMGLGVLFALRHRRAAEVASWWLCVGYTIVTLKHVVVGTQIMG